MASTHVYRVSFLRFCIFKCIFSLSCLIGLGLILELFSALPNGRSKVHILKHSLLSRSLMSTPSTIMLIPSKRPCLYHTQNVTFFLGIHILISEVVSRCLPQYEKISMQISALVGFYETCAVFSWSILKFPGTNTGIISYILFLSSFIPHMSTARVFMVPCLVSGFGILL